LLNGVFVVADFSGNNWQVPEYKKANNIMISNISSSLSGVIMSKRLLCVKICHTVGTVIYRPLVSVNRGKIWNVTSEKMT